MKNNKKETLMPSHKHWPEFRLKLNKSITNHVNGKPHSKCQGNLSQTIKILKSMHDIDVDETIILFKEYQGFCDCEILMNVARNFNNKIGQELSPP